jgi:WSC domain
VFSSGQTHTGPTTNPGPEGWASLGCYTDSVAARTLSVRIGIAARSTGMTAAQCMSACHASGYGLANVEYSGERYCDNQIENGGAPASDGCNMVYNSNPPESRGGLDRLSLYKLSSTATSTTSTTPSATPSPSPSPLTLPTG